MDNSGVLEKRSVSRRYLTTLCGFLAMCGGSLIALTFVHHRGVTLSGDEPAYAGEAFSLGRLHTWNLNSAFTSSGFHHLIGPAITSEEYYFNHGIYFPYHALGLSALLSPAFAVFDSLGAVHLELLALMSFAVVWLGV